MVFLFILLILLVIVLTIEMKIEIHNVNFTLHEPQLQNPDAYNNNKSKIFNIKDNYKLKITFSILGFLPIFVSNITSEKVNKISKKIKSLDIKSHFKSLKKDTSLLDTKEIIQNLNFKVKEFDLKANIGLDSIMLLTFIIPLISELIAIFLTRKRVKFKNQFYKIMPIYNNRKFIKC